MALSQRRRQLILRLRQRKTRMREGLVLVEGVRAVGEAMEAGAEIRFIVTSPRLAGAPGGRELASILEASGVEAEGVEDSELTDLADTERPQGVLAVCRQPESDLGILQGGGRYVVLDGIQDPGNVGTLVRAAVAFGVDGIVALEGTADCWGAKAVRAAAGMVFRLPVVMRPLEEVLPRLATEGIAVLVADSSGTDVASIVESGAWALVVGNEGAGPRAELGAAARARVSVPMSGSAESLNVGVAGAVLLYALTQEKSGA